ncbi:MAG: DMT family transporter [Gemmatimonadetes bacterium]|nr:DMT family transporter [Gemmatimonadota bacterium]MYD25480.1 DMT family transporter [Gemmatimonadota bacterium]
MNRHVTSGRWGLGLVLSLFTIFVWGGLPIVLKIMLISLDAFTMTWYRFVVAAALMALIVYRQGHFTLVRRLKGGYALVFLAAVLGFSCAYVFYPQSLQYISPSAAQVVNQISLLFLLLGAMLLFHERMTLIQVLGLLLLTGGIVLFFNEELAELLSGDSAMIPGIMWVTVAALALSTYTLTQKQLLQILPTSVILFLIYLAGSILILPFVRFESLLVQDTRQMILLNASAVISLVAFVTLVESLKHLEVFRVSMVLAAVPLVTVVDMMILAPLLPGLLQPEHLNLLSISGAVLVVIGSILGNLRRSVKSG